MPSGLTPFGSSLCENETDGRDLGSGRRSMKSAQQGTQRALHAHKSRKAMRRCTATLCCRRGLWPDGSSSCSVRCQRADHHGLRRQDLRLRHVALLAPWLRARGPGRRRTDARDRIGQHRLRCETAETAGLDNGRTTRGNLGSGKETLGGIVGLVLLVRARAAASASAASCAMDGRLCPLSERCRSRQKMLRDRTPDAAEHRRPLALPLAVMEAERGFRFSQRLGESKFPYQAASTELCSEPHACAQEQTALGRSPTLSGCAPWQSLGGRRSQYIRSFCECPAPELGDRTLCQLVQHIPMLLRARSVPLISRALFVQRCDCHRRAYFGHITAHRRRRRITLRVTLCLLGTRLLSASHAVLCMRKVFAGNTR